MPEKLLFSISKWNLIIISLNFPQFLTAQRIFFMVGITASNYQEEQLSSIPNHVFNFQPQRQVTKFYWQKSGRVNQIKSIESSRTSNTATTALSVFYFFRPFHFKKSISLQDQLGYAAAWFCWTFGVRQQADILLVIVISIIMFSLNELQLIQAFDNNLLFAWEILYADMLTEAAPLSADHLRRLVLLYSVFKLSTQQGMEKSSHLQGQQQNYFKLKIDHLMAQRKVIQCLHDEKAQTKRKTETHGGNIRDNRERESSKGKPEYPYPNGKPEAGVKIKQPPIKLNPSLQARKREIEMRLAYDIEESRTSKLSKMLKEESLKEERLQGILQKCMNSQQEKLTRKIQQRRHRASASSRMTASLKLDTSAISTCTLEPLDSYDALQTILDQIPFIDDIDADL